MLKYFRGDPTSHIIHFRNGTIVRDGQGINFWHMPMLSSIAAVPVVSQNAQFIFTETTANFQEVAIQGALTYRLTRPLDIAKVLNFTIDPDTGLYQSEDPETLGPRIINAVQANTRSHVNALPLEKALTETRSMARQVLDGVRDEGDLTALGIDVENLYFTAVAATPEMQKALETEYREILQGEADLAIYARRAAAVEEERKIRESELNTDVELEYRRRDLVDTQARNQLALAEADAKAEELKLAPYNDMPPQALVGLALKEWAANAGTIDNLSITPDLLSGLVGWVTKGQPGAAQEGK